MLKFWLPDQTPTHKQVTITRTGIVTHDYRPQQNNNYNRGRYNYYRGNGGQRHYNNFPRNEQRSSYHQNNNNNQPPRQRQPYGNQRGRGNQNNQQYRRVYTGNAVEVRFTTQMPPANMNASGTYPAHLAQNMTNTVQTAYPPAAFANQLTPQNAQRNFLGHLLNQSQYTQ